MELSTVQLFIVGAVAGLLAQAVKLVAVKIKKEAIGEKPVMLIVFAVSFVLGGAFMWPQLQPLFVAGEPFEIVQNLLSGMTAVAGAAWAVYGLLLGQVMDKLGLSQQKLLEKID